MSRAAAPWLLDQIRPKPYIRPALAAADEPMRQGHAYALTAVGNVLYEISTAPPGQRNDVAFRAGCRLIELARAPWACLDIAQVQAAFLRACETANVDGHFRDGEHWSIWLKAERKVTTPAVLPPAAHLGSVVAWDQMPPGVAAFGEAGQAPAWQIFDPADISAPAANPYDPFELAVAREAWNLRVREEAKRRLIAAAATPVDFSLEVLDDEGLDALAPAIPLVAGYLDLDSLARMNGPSGHGKSFVALDIAACVANGRSWHGKAVEQCPVLYVAAEGARGLRKRVKAWCEHTGLASSGVSFLPRALTVDGPEWQAFVDYAGKMGAKMIILDTQARMTVGTNENDNTEMSVIMAALDVLREATGACVLLIHHRGLTGQHGRGATSVKGALDTEIDVTKSGMSVTVTNPKQKDDVEAAPMILTLSPVGPSLVLLGAQEPNALGIFDPITTRDTGRERALMLVAVLRSNFALGNGGTRAEIKSLFVAVEGIREMSAAGQRQAWARAWGRLEDAGRIARNPIAERFRYVEIEGADDLANNPDALTEFGWPVAQKPTKAVHDGTKVV
jgi:predicted peroxiredoxin